MGKQNEACKIITVRKINVYCEWLTWKAILKSLGFRILPSLHLRAAEGKGQGEGPLADTDHVGVMRSS